MATEHSHGKCLCGSVSYRFPGTPLLTAVCHCRNCQRQTGSAFSIVAAVPRAGFALHGETKVFIDVSDSGRPVERHFCPECGSPIFSAIAPMPDMVLIKAGTLDAFAELTPSVEVFCDYALPFQPPLAGTERHPRSNV